MSGSEQPTTMYAKRRLQPGAAADGRFAFTVTLALALLSCPAGAAAAVEASRVLSSPQHASGGRSDDRPRASTCNRLRGKDLAPARSVKLVRHATQDGHDVLGCVLPRGRVHLIASREHLFTTSYDHGLLQVAGAITLVTSTYSSQYGHEQTTYVTSIRTGRSYTIAARRSMLGSEGCSGTTAEAAFINARGQAAAAIHDCSTDTIIAGFSADGGCRELDRGPSDQVPAPALRLSGRLVSWTHDATQHSTTLPTTGRRAGCESAGRW